MTEYAPLDCHHVCWACKFDNHPATAHGWPDVDDEDGWLAQGLSADFVAERMRWSCRCTCNPDMAP